MRSLVLRTAVALSLSLALSGPSAAAAQTPQSKPRPSTAKPAAKPAAVKPAPVPAPLPEPPPPPPPTDVQVRTRYTMGAQVSENSTYIRGPRQRFEFPGITMITQCDLKRSVQLHDATRHYLVTSTEAAPAAAPPAAAPTEMEAAMAAQMAAMKGNPGGAPAPPRGGVIVDTITLTDTGERQQMFGFEARRLKTVVSRQPGDGACESTAATIETDGWYADLPEHATCPYLAQPAPPPPPAGQQACVDRVETRSAGDVKLGFALKTAVTTTLTDLKNKEDGPEVSTMAMEVIDLKIASLDAALFDVPAGYTEVKDYQSLLPSMAKGGSVSDAVFGSIADGTSTVAPKNPGVIRVGVVTPANKSGKDLPDLRLLGSALSGFTRKPFEGVMVSGDTPADLHRDAAEKACDYVLVSDIAEVKTSKPNKVGGFLKKVSGDVSGPTEIHEARIDYKLYPVGTPAKPRTTSSIKVSSGGGFGIGSALKLAAFAGQMYLTMGMGSGMMMNMMGPGSAFGAMNGMGGMGAGMGMGRMNPGLGAAMSIASAGASMAAMSGAQGMPGMADDKMLETVQNGLSKAGKQVADELKKAKPAASAQK